MTNIKFLKNKIIFDGHSDTREECETITLMCNNLVKSKDFKTVEYKDGYAEFERIGNAKELKFVSALCDVTINFDSHITKVTSPDTYQWSASGQTQSSLSASSAGQTFTVTLEDGYIINTVTHTGADDVSNITSNTFTSTLNGDGTPITFTITSKLAPYRFKHYRNPESLGGTPLNIAYSDTAPSDTSKLWVKSSVPSEITFRKDADLIFDAITSSGTLPTKAYQIAAAAVGTKIYLFGGYNDSTSGAVVYITSIKMFDTITNSISTLSTVLPTKAYGISAVTVGTKIYLFGGCTTGSSYLNTINVFDTVNNTISTLSTTLYKGDYGIAAAAVGTKIYLFGGSESDTISVFDTENNSISTLSTKLPNVIGGATAIPTNSKIYLFGGCKNVGSLLDTIYVFDVESSSLLLAARLQTKTMDIAAGLVGTKIYLFGGFTGSSLNTIQMFDIVTNTISTLSKTLPQELDGIAIATVKNKIYLFGGRQEAVTNKYFDTIYNVNFAISLSANNIFVKESLTQNLFDLMGSPTRVKIGIEKVYKGNASNKAELCDAYLYPRAGTNWVNVNTGEALKTDFTVTITSKTGYQYNAGGSLLGGINRIPTDSDYDFVIYQSDTYNTPNTFADGSESATFNNVKQVIIAENYDSMVLSYVLNGVETTWNSPYQLTINITEDDSTLELITEALD